MPYYCEYCKEAITHEAVDYVVLIGGSNEARPQLLYHIKCAIPVLQQALVEVCAVCKDHPANTPHTEVE